MAHRTRFAFKGEADMEKAVDRTAEWERLREDYLSSHADRPASNGRGVHHVVMMCTDVERTINFYQGILGFPLTELFENRDYPGSTHFFFDIGNGNLLGFFDFPGLGLGPYAEVLGGLHHLAISVTPEHHEDCLLYTSPSPRDRQKSRMPSSA